MSANKPNGNGGNGGGVKSPVPAPLKGAPVPNVKSPNAPVQNLMKTPNTGSGNGSNRGSGNNNLKPLNKVKNFVMKHKYKLSIGAILLLILILLLVFKPWQTSGDDTEDDSE